MKRAAKKKSPGSRPLKKRAGQKKRKAVSKKAVKKSARRNVKKKKAGRASTPEAKRTAGFQEPGTEAPRARSPKPEMEPLFLRSTLISETPAPSAEQEARLPSHYGDNLIRLMIRDPYWLFSYWEIQPRRLEEVLTALSAEEKDVQWVLRLYDTTANREAPAYLDVPLRVPADRWYFHVQPGHCYFVEIGLLHQDGRFAALARSNEVMTPSAAVSDVVDEEWAGGEDFFEEIFARSGGTPSLAEGKSSLEFRRRLEEQILKGVSSGSGASWVSSGASLGAQQAAPRRAFWFKLDCEVIVYGATEPDAKVSFQGRPVKLRPDGTFSFRFALPDGEFDFEAKAESADGAEERTITPVVKRRTERPSPVLKQP